MSDGSPAARLPRRITLLTDFGTADGYVAAMKGVIAAGVPGAIIDDASHDVAPGDITGAAWALGAYWHYYPAGAIHIVVVDPGVGSERLALAVLADERWFLAPDNGVLSLVLQHASTFRCVAIDASMVAQDRPAPTFHGRDLFAPAAVLLANGAALESLGSPAEPLVLGPGVLEQLEGGVTGVILHVDRFGNLITNIPADQIDAVARGAGKIVFVAGSVHFPLRTTYADVAPGRPVAVIGSRGTVELSVRNGSAASLVDAGRGLEIAIREI